MVQKSPSHVSPDLKTKSGVDGVPDEFLLCLQSIDEQVGIFCWFVEIVVFSEVEVIEVGKRHSLGSRQPFLMSPKIHTTLAAAVEHERGIMTGSCP